MLAEHRNQAWSSSLPIQDPDYDPDHSQKLLVSRQLSTEKKSSKIKLSTIFWHIPAAVKN